MKNIGYILDLIKKIDIIEIEKQLIQNDLREEYTRIFL